MPFFPQFSNLFVAPYVFGGGVSLLLHMNGENGSTTFTDSSLNNYSLTAYGNAEISTAQYKYGGASGYFNRDDTTKVSMSSNSKFAFDSDFTIEMWVYMNQNEIGYQAFCSTDTDGVDATGWVFLLEDNGYIYFYGSDGNGAQWDIQIITNQYPPTEAWAHLAAVRHNGFIKIYLDGSDITTGANGNQNVAISAGSTLNIGHYAPLPENKKTINAYVDDLRITKGLAQYTSNFTPPDAELPNP